MQNPDDAPSLELLRCFATLHRERHLSRAAVRAGLSQPAMSRALSRLREAFDDPLFVRTPRGMLPTPRADALAPRVAAVLEAAQALVRAPRFEPARLARSFVLGTAGFFDAELLPRLVEALTREAPEVTIATRPIGEDAGEGLASGRLDLLIGVGESLPLSARRARLYQDEFVCAVRRDHPRVGRRLTLERFLELPHLLVAPGGGSTGRVDDALAARGLVRRVVARVHTFPSAPAIIAASDLVLTAPRRVLEPLARPFRLRLLPTPLSLPRFAVFVAWHPRMQEDPAHAWFRDQVLSASAADRR